MYYFDHTRQIERFELLDTGKCYPTSSNISLRSQLYLETIPITDLLFLKTSNTPPSQIPILLPKFSKTTTNQAFGPSYSIYWFKLSFEIPPQWLSNDKEVHLLWDSSTEALLFNEDCSKVLQGFTGDDGCNKRGEYILQKHPEKALITQNRPFTLKCPAINSLVTVLYSAQLIKTHSSL